MLVSYIIFNILNVVIQTVKSIVTIKCGKWTAAVVNAIAYGLYTYIVVLTASDLDLWFKIIVTAGANLVGVFIVKLIEEKKRREMLWKVEATIDTINKNRTSEMLRSAGISFNTVETDSKVYTIFNIFCVSQKESAEVKKVLENVGAQYFVSETKIL